MRDLRLVGLSDDRRHVVLRNDTGDEFRVAADERLRVALRGDRARLGQLEIQMDSALRPRDIQARIRAGESPEALAGATQTPLERIMGYAVPVLAEREHMCERARRATVRRKHTSGPTRLLGDAIAEQLQARDRDPDAVTWDSWRRDDGRWAVTVVPQSATPATYVFDVPGRYVVAADDEARSLVADMPPANDPTEMAIASAVAEANLHADIPVGPPPADADAPVTSIRQAPSLRTPPDEELAADAGTVVEPLEHQRAVGHDDVDAIARATSDGSGVDATGQGPRRRRDRRRTSVPSWDEIMLGGKPRRD
ncbi:MAG: DUF3071 domain-containing protein [Nocardioidaceae bacterium]|nr:DUF3071 domain-containing protein [Nocardioidaceae bacterium]